ncbi:MarR family winged helix-turn-helix transcriptional regulator [Novosphingobium aureum]|uniref:MarR family winged helix-turn-helix transcriptional regulator n=1 Tax=Novosphingobium aureum TaxID=2792964 RepID=UPI002B4610A4|nr:MarR family winged helix-turn-helix transcriptional regulator [Novosphingobium aureum]
MTIGPCPLIPGVPCRLRGAPGDETHSSRCDGNDKELRLRDNATPEACPTPGNLRGSDPVRRQITIRLTVLARSLRNGFDRRVGDIGVTRSQWTMIAAIARNPGASQRTIAEILEISEASAGRLIDKLCAEGLLERREREDDRRARAVCVTGAAAPLLDQLGEIASQGEERVFRGFSEAELEQLRDFLERMYENAGRD